MFFGKHLVITCVTLAVVVNGSPIEVAERRQLQTRSLGNFYFCVNDGWVKPCDLFAVDSGVCHSVPDGLNDNISAFGPDRGIGCILYGNYDCSGSSIFVAYPGNSYLAQVNFGDLTSSFRCIAFS